MININYHQLTVDQLERITVEITEKIESGDYDALQCYMIGKFLQELGGLIKDATFSRAYDEGQLYDEDSRKAYSASFDFGSTGARYNWDDDIEYKNIQKQLNARQELLKKAVKAKSGEEVIFEGEVIPKVSMKVPSKSTIKVSLGK